MKNTILITCGIDHEEYGENTIFLNEKKEILSIVSCNDGDWRGEYFNPILSQINVDVLKIDEEEIENLDEKLKQYFGF